MTRTEEEDNYNHPRNAYALTVFFNTFKQEPATFIQAFVLKST